MHTDLSEQEWHHVARGELTGPDGRLYRRRGSRLERGDGDVLIAEGAPLVLYFYAEGRLNWLDSDDARTQWRVVRPSVTSQQPRRRGNVEWTAGGWQDHDARFVLLLTGHC